MNSINPKHEWQTPELLDLDNMGATFGSRDKGRSNPYEVYCAGTPSIATYFPTTSGLPQSQLCA